MWVRYLICHDRQYTLMWPIYVFVPFWNKTSITKSHYRLSDPKQRVHINIKHMDNISIVATFAQFSSPMHSS